jgi:hypothetical protein
VIGPHSGPGKAAIGRVRANQQPLRWRVWIDDIVRAQGRGRGAEIRPPLAAGRWPQAGGGVFQVGRDYPVEDGDLLELHT